MKITKIIENGDEESLEITERPYNDIYRISKSYYEDGKFVKTFNMSIQQNMLFDGTYYGNIEKQRTENCISFDFDISDPLYFCLSRFLENEESIIIQDDNTYADLLKYFEVSRIDDKIVLNIYCNKNSYLGNKFKIFVKGDLIDSKNDKIGFELRSKLFDLFNDAISCLEEENHQITMDEHIEVLKRVKKVNL